MDTDETPEMTMEDAPLAHHCSASPSHRRESAFRSEICVHRCPSEVLLLHRSSSERIRPGTRDTGLLDGQASHLPGYLYDAATTQGNRGCLVLLVNHQGYSPTLAVVSVQDVRLGSAIWRNVFQLGIVEVSAIPVLNDSK